MSSTLPVLEEIRQDEQSRLFARFANARLMLLPIPSLLALLLVANEPLGWRTAVLSTCLMSLFFLAVWEWRIFRRAGLGALNVRRTALIAAIAHALVVVATGGIESPILPPILLVAAMVQLVAWPWARRLVLAGHLTLIVGLTLIALTSAIDDFVPHVFGGGPRAGHGDVLVIVAGFVLCVMVMIAAGLSSSFRDTLSALEARWIAARDQMLALHKDQTAALTGLSAEIAHELKNPLASIKGLAALVARSLTGKDAERMDVLRREVDRMQAVLEEFLTFARPMGPLARERVDLRTLAEAAAALHEGMCNARGIGLAVDGDACVPASGDPRKLHQVIVNLVQNAIEASAPGSSIELSVAARAGGGTALSVCDRGVGLPAEMESQVFSPGLTTKPRGSGIGLSVARGLIAQHGGELTLAARPGGGCVASFTLPAEVP